MLIARGHAPVVKHTPQVVLESKCFLGDPLIQDIIGVLEVGELGASFGRGGFAGIEDLGAEF